MLLYCKISYFAFAALGTVVGFILRELNGKLLIALVVTFALCCAAWWFVLGINPIHYFGDLKVAAEAQSLSLRRQYLLDSLRANRLTVSVLLAGVAVTCIALRDAFPRSWKRLATRFVVVELFLICATFAIASGNAPEGADLPLLFVCLLFALSTLTSLRRETSAVGTQSNKLAFWCVFLVGAPLLAGPMIVNDISSFSIALGRKKLLENHSIGYLAFDSSSLSDFIIPADSNWHTAYWLAHDVPSRINDGIYLLHQHSMDGKKILPLTFGNPFAYAMQFTPPKGAPLWWDLDFSVSIRNLPKPEKLFHDVDAVIYPILHASDQGCCKQTVEKMLEFYEPYITKHYVVEYRSSYWVLRVRTEANLD